MENSYRFLMIAGTFLLGIMLLSILVYVFAAGARSNRAIDDSQREQQLVADNAKFEHYNKENNTVSEMISLINLVNNYNSDRYSEDCIKLTIYTNAGNGSYLKMEGNTKDLGRNKVYLNTGEKISVYQFASENAASGGLFSREKYYLIRRR